MAVDDLPAANLRGGAPAAWYADPWRVAAYRWFDGRNWTSFTSGGPAAEPAPEAPAAPPVAGPSPPAVGTPPPRSPVSAPAPAASPVGPGPVAAVPSYGYAPSWPTADVPRGPERPVAARAVPVEPARRKRMVLEVLIVLAVFPLPYVLTALVALAQSVLNHNNGGRIPLPIGGYPGLSLVVDLVLIAEPLAAAALVGYLLTMSGEGGYRAIGLDFDWPRTDAALIGPVFVLCFLLPLLGGAFVLELVHIKGVAPGSQHLPTYFALVEVWAAAQAGIVEEIVVLGYLVRRLEQLGLRTGWVVALAVVARISYHLYYGWGVLPFAVWALVSIVIYRRYRRLWPFILVHFLWDLGVSLTPWFSGVPILLEFLILAPATLVFFLLWRDRLPLRPSP